MNKKLLFIFPLFITGKLFAQKVELPPVTFGGGVNYKQSCSEIRDDQACDSSNMISDFLGAASKRNGNKKYVEQAISTNPVNSLWRAYQSTGTTLRKALIATSWDGIFKSTSDLTSTNNPVWIKVSSGLGHNQNFSFAPFRNRLIMTGSGLTDPILSLDITIQSSTAIPLVDYDGTTNAVRIRAKYNIISKNYYITGNVLDITNGTTWYPSRLHYSLLLNPSSFTALRFIDYRSDDGEEITGLGEMFDKVHIFKTSSIGELTFNTLNLIASGGDQTLTTIVSGFGVIAPKTLVNTGEFYIFLAKDGIRMWDGGRRSRLNVSEESRIISTPVEPIIKKIIDSGTFAKCSGIYYPKNYWYIFSYEDPDKFPKGRTNSILIYDLITGEWHPFNGWYANSFAVQDGANDVGEFFYGDSGDGYVYMGDREANANDDNLEKSINSMDNLVNGTSSHGSLDFINVVEGTASIRLVTANEVRSTVTFVTRINLGEFDNKTKTKQDDQIQFSIRVTSPTNLDTIRIDLLVSNTSDAFNANITSYTISRLTLVADGLVENQFHKVENRIFLLNFSTPSGWTDTPNPEFPLVVNKNFYGIRFVATSTSTANGSTVNIDNVRLVANKETPLNSFRKTKQYSYNTIADKRWRQIVLNAEKTKSSIFFIDVFSDFGKLKTIAISTELGRGLYITGSGIFGTEGAIAKLDEETFNTMTFSLPAGTSNTRMITTDRDFVYYSDERQIITKVNKNDFLTIVSSFGGLGSGTTNFNNIRQIAIDDKNLYIADRNNNRIKIHSKRDLTFINQFGTLGVNTTSFNLPSAVGVDEGFIYVINDRNSILQKFNKNNFNLVNSVVIQIATDTFAINTIPSGAGVSILLAGNPSMFLTQEFIYLAYTSYNDSFFPRTRLEKRKKSDLSLLNSALVSPQSEDVSTSSGVLLLGNITSDGDKNLFLCYILQGGNLSFIQKRKLSDFGFLAEKSIRSSQYRSVSYDNLAFLPNRQTIIKDLESEGRYIQLNFRENELDNTMTLFNHSFIAIPEPLKER